MGRRDYNVYLHIHQTQISGRFPSGSQSSSARPNQSKDRSPLAVGKCLPEGIPWDRPSGTPLRYYTCCHFLEAESDQTLNQRLYSTFTPSVVERHAAFLKVVKVPLWNPILTGSRGPEENWRSLFFECSHLGRRHIALELPPSLQLFSHSDIDMKLLKFPG